jgi:hypothetical protein
MLVPKTKRSAVLRPEERVLGCPESNGADYLSRMEQEKLNYTDYILNHIRHFNQACE